MASTPTRLQKHRPGADQHIGEPGREDSISSKGNPARPGRVGRFGPVIAILLLLALGYALGLDEYLSLELLAQKRAMLAGFVEQNLLLSAALFVLTYATAVAVAFPAPSALTVLAGFLFGWLLGGVLTAIAATAGATALYLVASTAFGDVLRRRAGPRVSRLAEGLRQNAFGTLLALRLAPVFPFLVVNVAAAIFGVGFRTYVLATLIGILPATFAYAYLGEGLESVILAAEATGRDPTLSDLVTTEITAAFAALAIVAAIPTIVRAMRSR